MVEPLLELQRQALRDADREDVVAYVMRYHLFKVGLGMAKIRRADDVWRGNEIVQTPYLKKMLPRKVFYDINRLVTVDITALLKNRNRQWQRAWRPGGTVTGGRNYCPLECAARS